MIVSKSTQILLRYSKGEKGENFSIGRTRWLLVVSLPYFVKTRSFKFFCLEVTSLNYKKMSEKDFAIAELSNARRWH